MILATCWPGCKVDVTFTCWCIKRKIPVHGNTCMYCSDTIITPHHISTHKHTHTHIYIFINIYIYYVISTANIFHIYTKVDICIWCTGLHHHKRLELWSRYIISDTILRISGRLLRHYLRFMHSLITYVIGTLRAATLCSRKRSWISHKFYHFWIFFCMYT